MQCRERSVKCKVCIVECKVWSVECSAECVGVQSVERQDSGVLNEECSL